jgi:hypothetical protein
VLKGLGWALRKAFTGLEEEGGGQEDTQWALHILRIIYATLKEEDNIPDPPKA